MRNSLKLLGLSSSIIVIFLFSVFAISLYTILAFLLAGHEILSGVFGSDTWAFISHLKLLADHFPNYPFWNPLEGGGVSLKYGYPSLTHTIIIITSKLTPLTLVEAFKFWEFATVPIFAFGVFLYTWVRLRIPVAAFLAGLFYVISPIAWMWAFEWGFVAEHIAAMFAPFAILFFDLFLLRVLDWNWSAITRIYLITTIILLGLSFMAHPFVFTGILVFMIVYGFFLAIFRSQSRLKSLFRVGGSIGAVFVVTVTLFAFWIIPFYDYTTIANNSSTVVDKPTKFNRDEGIRNDLDFTQIFSISPPKVIPQDEYFAKYQKLQEGTIQDGNRVLEKGYVWRNLSFPLAVSILFFLGLVTSLVFWSKKTPQLFFASFVLILLSVNMYLLYYISVHPRFPFSFIVGWFGAWRGHLLVARVIVPMAAAFGAYGFFEFVLSRIKFLDKYQVVRLLKSIILSVFALIFSFAILYQFRNKPVLPAAYLVYGKEASVPTRAVYLRDFWREGNTDECSFPENKGKLICRSEQFNFHFDGSAAIAACKNKFYDNLCNNQFSDDDVNNWVKTCTEGGDQEILQTICKIKFPLWNDLLSSLSLERILAKTGEFPQKIFSLAGTEEVFKAIPDDSFIRFDTSPMVARYSMIGPYAKPVPQLPVYINSSSLIHRMWGYQQSNFYASDPVYPDAAALPEIAQWFGIKYIIINENFDPVEKLEQAGFKKIPDYPIYQFEQGESLAGVSKKPAILVIGREDIRAYEEVFKKAPFGFIPYDKALIVKGKEKIDDYSISELKKFEVIFLHGYSYKSKKAAWQLLDEYVRQGGRLFIDTGWQFTTPDWNIGTTADFFPTTTLNWTNFGKTKDFQLHEGVINVYGIDTSGFRPLIWEDNPWGISTGETLKTWSKPILTIKNRPLVAGGQYGEGRVIWSGMNLLGHIQIFDSKYHEMIFASRLIDWLLEGFSSQSYSIDQDFTAKRLSFDKVKFTFKKEIEVGNFYFKEAHHPKWQAKLIGSSNQTLPIYKAGPGFMYVNLPSVKPGESLEFSIVGDTRENFARLLTLVTIVGLALFLIKPGILRLKIFAKFIPGKKIKSWWESEEER